jgi:hypothetical protein
MLYPRSVTHKQNRATTHRLAELETSRETPPRHGRARMGAVTTSSPQQFATVRFCRRQFYSALLDTTNAQFLTTKD